MNYFDHNATTEGLRRIRALPLSPDTGFPALFMSALDVESRRLDGSIYRTAALCPEVLDCFPLATNFPDPRRLPA